MKIVPLIVLCLQNHRVIKKLTGSGIPFADGAATETGTDYVKVIGKQSQAPALKFSQMQLKMAKQQLMK